MSTKKRSGLRVAMSNRYRSNSLTMRDKRAQSEATDLAEEIDEGVREVKRKKREDGMSSLEGWSNVIREMGEQRTSFRERFPEHARENDRRGEIETIASFIEFLDKRGIVFHSPFGSLAPTVDIMRLIYVHVGIDKDAYDLEQATIDEESKRK